VDTANGTEIAQILVTIATVFVVGLNALMGLGLAITAWWVWRSRRPLRQFARDLDQLERELRATLPEVPAQLAASREQLRNLNDWHQVTIARITLIQQILCLMQLLAGYLRRGRSRRFPR
jgi:Flp pilus assembly protein TadB